MFSFVKKKENQEPERLTAFLDGKVIPIAEVPDQVFSAGIMGDGVAIEPENHVVTAPAAAEVTAVMEDSRHALGLKFANGVECLIHVGLDTVDMKGKGFQLHVSLGEKVETGAPLITFSPEEIKQAGHMALTILAVTDEAGVKKIHFHTGIHATAGETVIADFE